METRPSEVPDPTSETGRNDYRTTRIRVPAAPMSPSQKSRISKPRTLARGRSIPPDTALRTLRRQRYGSQRDAATAIGITRGVLQRAEVALPIRTAAKKLIETAFNYPYDQLTLLLEDAL